MKIHTGQGLFDEWFKGKLTSQGCANLAPYINQLELDRDNAVILVRQAIEAGFDPKSFVNENLGSRTQCGMITSTRVAPEIRESRVGENPAEPSLRQSASNAEKSGEPLDNGSFLAQ